MKGELDKMRTENKRKRYKCKNRRCKAEFLSDRENPTCLTCGHETKLMRPRRKLTLVKKEVEWDLGFKLLSPGVWDVIPVAITK